MYYENPDELASITLLDKSVLQQPHQILTHFPNVAFHAVAIAASAGGLKAITTILSALPADFPAAILFVQHLHPTAPSYCTDLLSRETQLQVKQAAEGELLRPGTLYTCMPNRHLLVNSQGMLALSEAEKVNFARPAADVLLRSLASSYKARSIAVILTGRGNDGAIGVQAVKKYGGMVIVQDPATAKYAGMPSAAKATGKADFVLPLDAIANQLVTLTVSKFDPIPQTAK